LEVEFAVSFEVVFVDALDVSPLSEFLVIVTFLSFSFGNVTINFGA